MAGGYIVWQQTLPIASALRLARTRCTIAKAQKVFPWMGYSALRASPLALLGAALRAFAGVARRHHGGPDAARESVRVHGIDDVERLPERPRER